MVAPFEGTVGDIPARLGQRVDPSTYLATLDNNELLEAEWNLPLVKAWRAFCTMPL
ncbi:hypothetical protein [Pajaroellobacter abortibovis]|uniref:hypothetical protein n=1 Tax=Pajaroellobacter abortibovis TaxID=1882918 RepID=UPI0012EB2691|nr:hypothetical protein [Pajaroellobacter abortibovis]